MIGVHIRCTDNQLKFFSKWNKNVSVNKILEKLDELVNSNKGYGIFLSTDSIKIYKHVIEKERNLGYKGKCVEAIPHITDEIKNRIK